MSICVPYNFVKELDWKYVMETTLSGGRNGGVGVATFAPQKSVGYLWRASCKKLVSDFLRQIFVLVQMSSIFACDLGLNWKTLPVIFSAVLFFIFKRFSWTSTGSKCALRWFYCLEKQKLSLERTPPGKKLRLCIRYLWKVKEKPANLNMGVCFSMKWKATCQNWAHLDEEKKFGLKGHLRASCTKPFNCKLHDCIKSSKAS